MAASEVFLANDAAGYRTRKCSCNHPVQANKSQQNKTILQVLMRKSKCIAGEKNETGLHDFAKTKVPSIFPTHGLMFLPGILGILHFPYPNFATANCLA